CTTALPTGKYISSAASSIYPDSQNISYIHVASLYRSGPNAGKLRGSEQVLCELVFEFYNVRHAQEKKDLARKAFEGTITKNSYIQQSAQIEYDALQQLHQFYLSIWKPYGLKNGINIHPAIWQMPEGPFQDWITRFTENGYPEKAFGPRYDYLRKLGSARYGPSGK